MFSIKNHPFSIEAHFASSIVLTFAIPKEQLISLIPECLSLDTFQEEWAFLAMAMVDTKNLRPKGMPKIFGNDFFLIGYRLFVTYINKQNKILRGLHILKSETNKKRMEVLGNLFTNYNYSTTDIFQTSKGEDLTIKSNLSNFEVKLKRSNNAPLPVNSPFESWKEARRFAGPLPFTFKFNAQQKEMLIIEGVRSNWKPSPIEVKDYSIPYLKTLGFKDIFLANAFEVRNVPYYWKKGKIEQWEK